MMKQEMKKLLRRTLAAAAALCLLTAGATTALAAPELNPDTAVNDYANILSTQTETYVENISVALQDTCGAQIGVYTTEYIGNSTMEGYAYDVLNTWGLGSADKDNGVLLLLVPGEDDYYVTRGAGLEAQLTISKLGTILDQDLEPNWVNQDYDAGTQQTVRAIAEELCSIYGIPVSTLDNAGQRRSGSCFGPCPAGHEPRDGSSDSFCGVPCDRTAGQLYPSPWPAPASWRWWRIRQRAVLV